MEKILYRVYSSRRVSLALKIISHVSVLVSVLAYAVGLAIAFSEGLEFFIRLAVAGAIPFILLSVLRRLINAPRPYELYPFYKEAPKGKRGMSFPSRHVFSAFTVSALVSVISPWLSVAAAVAGITLAVSRVLLGIHFMRDVTAGALVGAVSGLLGLFIIVI